MSARSGVALPAERRPGRGAAIAHPGDVDCRIEVVRGAGGVVVRLAGRFRHAQVPDFMETCVVAGSPLRVDLSELFSADAVGLDALLRVRERGATFEGVPTYLQLTIDSLTGKGRPGPRRSGSRRRGC